MMLDLKKDKKTILLVLNYNRFLRENFKGWKRGTGMKGVRTRLKMIEPCA